MSNPTATINIKGGKRIVVELLPQCAPNTVNNFISLANKGFYNGLIFHRVIRGFMIQGGCPHGTGTGGAGYNIKGEFANNGVENDLAHNKGVISMARANNPNSASSQFFIMHEDAHHLNGAYAAFGKVIEGIATVDEIADEFTNSTDRPYEDIVIESIVVDCRGEQYPEPIKC